MGKRKVPPFFLFRLPTFLVVQQSPALKLFLVMQGDAISHSKVVGLSLYTLLYSFEENKSPTRKCVDLNLHLRQTPLQGGQNLYRLPQNDCHCQLFPAITILPGTWSNSVAAVRIFISGDIISESLAALLWPSLSSLNLPQLRLNWVPPEKDEQQSPTFKIVPTQPFQGADFFTPKQACCVSLASLQIKMCTVVYTCALVCKKAHINYNSKFAHE